MAKNKVRCFLKQVGVMFLLLLGSMTVSAQIGAFGLDEIKDFAKTDAYAKLYARFTINDTTITQSEYVQLYYGFAFTSKYKPNARHDSVDALNEYVGNNLDHVDFNKVLDYTRQILSEYPFSIEHIYLTAIACEKLNKPKQAAQWYYKYEKLIRTILLSGDGLREESAYMVLNVNDEYMMLNALEFTSKGQTLKSKGKLFYDVITLAPNPQGIEKLFFDVNLFFVKSW